MTEKLLTGNESIDSNKNTKHYGYRRQKFYNRFIEGTVGL